MGANLDAKVLGGQNSRGVPTCGRALMHMIIEARLVHDRGETAPALSTKVNVEQLVAGSFIGESLS